MKISELEFIEKQQGEDNILYFVYTDLGRITVLDRMTGWGNGTRDTETGYTDTEGAFWLASCMFDIRDYPELEVSEAIAKIKENANTCVGA